MQNLHNLPEMKKLVFKSSRIIYIRGILDEELRLSLLNDKFQPEGFLTLHRWSQAMQNKLLASRAPTQVPHDTSSADYQADKPNVQYSPRGCRGGKRYRQRQSNSGRPDYAENDTEYLYSNGMFSPYSHNSLPCSSSSNWHSNGSGQYFLAEAY